MGEEEFDYDSLLEAAYEAVPDTVRSAERFEIPTVDVLSEGKMTIIRNFVEVCEKIRRDPNDVLKYLLREFGTAGNLEGRRAVLKSRIPENSIQSRFNTYVETYVICSECGRPDTELIREGRVLMLKCDACGAKRPVTVRKGPKPSDKPKGPVVVGNVYEVTIEATGKRGDGIARMGPFTIYVKGNYKKGARLRVRIDKINGTNAFATAIP